MAYYVYILKSISTDRYYVGSTQDIQARLERHNQGRSKYTKPFRPWEVAYTERFETRSEAVKREHQIKGRKSSEYLKQLCESESV